MADPNYSGKEDKTRKLFLHKLLPKKKKKKKLLSSDRSKDLAYDSQNAAYYPHKE